MLRWRSKSEQETIQSGSGQRQVDSSRVAHLGIVSWLREPMLKGLRDGWGFRRACLIGVAAGLLYLVWTYVHGSPPSFSLSRRLYKALFPFLVIFVYVVIYDFYKALKERSTSE